MPSQRKLRGVGVGIEELCETTRYDAHQQRVRHRFFDAPQDFPTGLQRVTDPAGSWQSPVAATALQGTVAWKWLQGYFGNPFGAVKSLLSPQLGGRSLSQ